MRARGTKFLHAQSDLGDSDRTTRPDRRDTSLLISPLSMIESSKSARGKHLTRRGVSGEQVQGANAGTVPRTSTVPKRSEHCFQAYKT